jgi:hypothetical protein
MSNWTNANKNEITRQSDVVSKPIRENFNEIQTAINDNQTQISALSTAASGAEVSGARPYHTDLKSRLDSIRNGQYPYVKSGFAVTESSPAAMTVDVAAGEASVNGVDVRKSTSSTSGTITAPTTNNRFDVVVISSDNTISVVTGSESATPVLPVISASQKALGIIALTPSTTSITNSIITDARSQGCVYWKSGIQSYKWKIQDAIDALSTGGNIYVGPGSYYEDLTFDNDQYIEFDYGMSLYGSDGVLDDIGTFDLSSKTDLILIYKGGQNNSDDYEINGNVDFKNTIKADVITESTTDNGLVIEGVSIKDGVIDPLATFNSSYTVISGSVTQDNLFDFLSPFIPTNGDKIKVNGAMEGSGTVNIYSVAERKTSNTIDVTTTSGSGTQVLTIQDGTSFVVCTDIGISV